MTRFAFEDQFSEIVHAAGVQDAVKMIAFMLDDAGMESLCHARDFAAVHIETAIANVKRPFDETAQAGYRQASFPATLDLAAHDLDLGIDQHRQWRGAIEALRQFGVAAPLGRLKNDDAQRDMDLRRSETSAVRVDHRLDHVGDQTPYLRRGGIGDWVSHLRQHGMAHAGYFQNCHVFDSITSAYIRTGLLGVFVHPLPLPLNTHLHRTNPPSATLAPTI